MIEYRVKVYDDREEWCLNGQLHREDGPAIKCSNGDKEWWLNGKRHRENGPAVTWSNGDEYWYLEGKEYTKEEFDKLQNGYATIEINGQKFKLIEVK